MINCQPTRSEQGTNQSTNQREYENIALFSSSGPARVNSLKW